MGTALPSVMTFASGYYIGGCTDCCVGSLSEVSKMCDLHAEKVKIHSHGRSL